MHIGYRRLKGKAGTWWARHYIGNRQYETENLGAADDVSNADDVKILNFWQAQDKARKRMVSRATATADLTVAQAVEKYIAERDKRDSRRKGRPVRSDAGQRLRRYVLGREARGKQEARKPAPLAGIELRALDDSDLSKWRSGLPETLKATAKQRLTNDLKAALNAAYEDNRGQLPATLPATIKYGLKSQRRESHESDDDDIGVRENQILSDAQVSRLIRAARKIDAEQEWGGDLFRLVLVLAATGTRFSQAARLRVRDCQIANSRLLVPVSRKGRGKKSGNTPVPVGGDVLDALQQVITGRAGNRHLLERWRHRQIKGNEWEKTGRGPWSSSELVRPWHAIRERARLPHVIPYSLRHSSIVRCIRKNLPIRLVAAMHDTSVQMVERHYSRWIVDGLEELAAQAIVPLVPRDEGGKVLPMRGRAG